MRFLWVMPLLLAACADADFPVVALEPHSSVTLDYAGSCKTVSNLTKDSVSYIPLSPPQVWRDFEDHSDQHGRKVLKVTPCPDDMKGGGQAL